MKLLRFSLPVLILAAGASADTVTLVSNASYNGVVVSLDSKEVTLRMKRKDHDAADVPIARSNVLRIEFNDLKVDEGAAPEGLGARPGSAGKVEPPKRDSDKIILNGGQTKLCSGLSFDGNIVKCGDTSYPRDQVWRLYLAQQ